MLLYSSLAAPPLPVYPKHSKHAIPCLLSHCEVYRTFRSITLLSLSIMQQHSRNIALSALLVLFSVSACSAAGSSSFSDWLASKTGAALQSEGYDYSGVREYVHQCLKEVNNKNRRKIGDPNVPASLYFE